MFKAAAIAVAACLVAAPGASAGGHALTLGDARESSCTGSACTPDITSIAVYYDTDGTFLASTTFAQALPAYDPLGATRVRVNIGRRLTADGSACTPVGGVGQLTGESGDIRIEIGAYDGGTSPSSAANGVLYRTGSALVLATTRTVSGDRKTLTVSVDSPQVAGLDLRCTQADLADDADTGAAVRDAVTLGWFPGYEPAASEPPGSDPGEPAATPAVKPPGAGGAAPSQPALVSAPAVRGTKEVTALLTCSAGRWKRATRFAYRWFRGGKRIAKASSRRYRVRPADRGRVLRCRVTATNANGRKVAASQSVRIPR